MGFATKYKLPRIVLQTDGDSEGSAELKSYILTIDGDNRNRAQAR